MRAVDLCPRYIVKILRNSGVTGEDSQGDAIGRMRLGGNFQWDAFGRMCSGGDFQWDAFGRMRLEGDLRGTHTGRCAWEETFGQIHSGPWQSISVMALFYEFFIFLRF